MHLKLLFFSLILTTLFNCKDPNANLFVGTYTDGKSESKGIYQFQFNPNTGELSNMQLAAATKNPSFITYSPDKKHLYAVNEYGLGSVSAFKIDTIGALKLLNTVKSNGSGPCYISTNKKGTKAVVTNYGGGSLSLYNILENGKLSEANQVFEYNITEKASHAHSAQFFKNELYVSDLGMNAVYQYKLDDAKKDYTQTAASIVPLTEEAGPRHFALTQDGQFIYIINEDANTVTAAKKSKNTFNIIGNYPTLEKNFKGKSFCADIHLSKNERFLYGSNRGENSIVVFKRDPKTGALEKIQNIAVHGNWPRNFTLDPTGKFLLVANQKSNNIVIFSIDSATGKLSFLHDVKAPAPVCLLF